MSLHAEWVEYGNDREHRAYAAWPTRAALPLPAVLVLQEAWGVDAHIEDVVQRIASAGYVAFAPDLYARAGVRPLPLTRERLAELQGFVNMAPPTIWMDPAARDAALASRPEDERGRIEESLGTMKDQLKLDSYVPALLAATRFLRHDYAATRGKNVGAVGFCMGGGLAALLACNDPELKGSVIYYGSSPPLDLVPKIQCPVLGFYGGLDERINAGIPAFVDAMKKNSKSFEPKIYDGAAHAFSNDRRPSYNVAATRDAFARTLDFWNRTLP